MNDHLHASQLGAGPLTRCGEGSVHFSRQDGPAMVQITAALSQDAAVELDAFLRELIARDEPRLEAGRQEQWGRMLAAQRKAAEEQTEPWGGALVARTPRTN